MSLISRIAYAVAVAGVHAVRTRSARAWRRSRTPWRHGAPVAPSGASLQRQGPRGR